MDKKRLLKAVAKESGFDSVDSMLEAAVTDSIVPGVCVSCEAIEYEVEPDATANYCSECCKHRVKSVLVLAEII